MTTFTLRECQLPRTQAAISALAAWSPIHQANLRLAQKPLRSLVRSQTRSAPESCSLTL
jgi:hypothetical protein